MLRWLVALLLVANLAVLAWSHGWLDAVPGLARDADREPERLSRQVHPEAVRVLGPRAASAALAAASAASAAGAGACLEAGPFTETELAAAQKELTQAGIAAARFSLVSLDRPGVWIVYMGKYANREGLLKKQEELQRMHLPFEELHAPPALEPGLSLGRYEAQADANAALDKLVQRGVHTARVVALAPPARVQLLRADHAEPALQEQLHGLKGAALGSGFASCSAAAR